MFTNAEPLRAQGPYRTYGAKALCPIGSGPTGPMQESYRPSTYGLALKSLWGLGTRAGQGKADGYRRSLNRHCTFASTTGDPEISHEGPRLRAQCHGTQGAGLFAVRVQGTQYLGEPGVGLSNRGQGYTLYQRGDD